ncbi:MAG: hypothetical protein IKO36_10950 [Bacteroidaceae bacterium]|nr:hypothetical protein [Bacteroidaceae bacterium]
MKIKHEYTIEDKDEIEIVKNIRKKRLSLIDEMIESLNKVDDFFVNFKPNEFSDDLHCGNRLFSDVEYLLNDTAYSFNNQYERGNIFFFINKLEKADEVYVMKKTIQRILEISKSVLENYDYLMPSEIKEFHEIKNRLLEEKQKKEMNERINIKIERMQSQCQHKFGPKTWTWTCGGYHVCQICGKVEDFYERD